MIEQLDIENLKSFGGRHEIRLAPLTLIFGPNSAGKSSLLQSLAVLKQTLEPLGTRVDLEEPPLALRGEVVDLGSFPGAIHGHDRKRELYIGLQFVDRQRRAPRPPHTPRGTIYAGLGFGYEEKRGAVVQRRAIVGDGEHHVEFLPAAGPKNRGPARFQAYYYRLARGAEDSLLELAAARAAHVKRGSAGRNRWTELHQMLSERLREEGPLVFAGRGFFPSQPLLGERMEARKRLEWTPHLRMGFDDLTRGRAQALTDLLSTLAYLGPLRAAPTRFQLMSSELPTNVGASGEHTPMLLARDPKLVEEVNGWFKELDISYRLSVEPLGSEKLGVELGDLLATTLHDTRSGLAVTPQDVGFGVSQLLPVVVQLLAGERRTVCIEQPEIHIHPRLQARVGDLLISATHPERGNQVLVETHSEHLMLRLQRRLRERKNDWLTPDHIAVIYVDVDSEGRAQPQRLRLDEAGHFADEWPHGFFAERVGEVLGGSVNPPRKPRRRREPA